MSTAIYIATKKAIKGFDPFVNGKAIGRLADTVLDDLCTAAGVESLLGLISADPEELAEFLDSEGFDSGESELPQEEWFPPERGLTLVRGLIAHVQSNTQALPQSTDILDDLREYETVLTKLAEKKVAWHFAIDS